MQSAFLIKAKDLTYQMNGLTHANKSQHSQVSWLLDEDQFGCFPLASFPPLWIGPIPGLMGQAYLSAPPIISIIYRERMKKECSESSILIGDRANEKNSPVY